IAIIVSVWFGKRFIQRMKSKHIEETQRDEKLDPFNVSKTGVPTMGGIIIIAATLIPCLLISKLHNIYMILMIITTLILGAIGFADDYIKTFKKNKEGINGWVKIGGQVMLGLIVGLTLRFSPAAQMNEAVQIGILDNKEVLYKTPDVKSTRTTIPFVKNHNLNYADLFKWAGQKWMYILGWAFFVLVTVFAVAAVSNGSNLNDGMDGMSAGNTAIMALTVGILAYLSSNGRMASYFNIMYIPGTEEIVVFLSAFVGALLGYLWYNSFPAQVFMGDTGSLTIGGIIAVAAVIIHKELLLPIICGVFLFESLSVILQRLYYKTGKKKGVHRRIWKRTPVHDHFRTSLDYIAKVDPGCTVKYKGSPQLHHEAKITLRFWIVSILLAAFTILTLKIR
ncbi:MAG: phospho-N-acetylmuramoyl-pentapeptide-transferase, partial [Bacteroidales bacterium]|nr:phospho-N-acetylmuramoyl-pentapeptide-transferase [Bacteroidales bacterium]